MPPRLRVESVVFFETPEAAVRFGFRQAGVDGYVWYEIEHDEPGAVAHMTDGTTRENVAYSYMMQPFGRGESAMIDGSHVWGWDGNREAPTLTPSFLCWDNRVRVHLFLRAGRIDLCGDSTVVLA